MKKITPFLWFDNQAEEAMNFYTSVFRNARPGSVMRTGDGKVMSTTFELEGQEFIALNGGPHYTFTPAVSFFISCTTQEEIDLYWERLSAGGQIQQCGWLQDRFGLSWQVVPTVLGELLQDKDPVKAGRVMQAMLQMKKLDIAALEAAARG